MEPLRYRFQTLKFSASDIHLRTLRDRLQFHDPDGDAERCGVSPASWPLFGVLWPAGEVLAHVIDEHNLAGLRVLEVGCGMGLASLVANQQQADITASDYHPMARDFLDYNCELNGGRPIPFLLGDWRGDPGEAQKYDLIIGSDLLYEPDHAGVLANFIHHHAKPAAKVIIVDPARGNAPRFCRGMEGHGFSHSRSRFEHQEQLSEAFSGYVHRFSR